MHPNTSFLKYFPEAKLPEVSEKADRSICLRIRAFIMIRKIITGYHLDEIIGRLIGKNTGLFLDLAAYSIVTENNAGMVLQEISVLLFKMDGTAAIITVKRSISLMIRPIRITRQVILSASRSDI